MPEALPELMQVIEQLNEYQVGVVKLMWQQPLAILLTGVVFALGFVTTLELARRRRIISTTFCASLFLAASAAPIGVWEVWMGDAEAKLKNVSEFSHSELCGEAATRIIEQDATRYVAQFIDVCSRQTLQDTLAFTEKDAESIKQAMRRTRE